MWLLLKIKTVLYNWLVISSLDLCLENGRPTTRSWSQNLLTPLPMVHISGPWCSLSIMSQWEVRPHSRPQTPQKPSFSMKIWSRGQITIGISFSLRMWKPLVQKRLARWSGATSNCSKTLKVPLIRLKIGATTRIDFLFLKSTPNRMRLNSQIQD